MIIGVPKEVKVRENRSGLLPSGVKALVADGHKVLVETKLGEGIGIADEAYKKAGAEVESSASELWQKAEMIIKVKEPISSEYELMRKDQILYTYLHLAADKPLTLALCERKVTSIAYETVELADGSLPLLRPMSQIAGRMSVQAGTHLLEKHNGGKGILIGGVPGVRRGHVAIIGGGVVGTHAAKMAIGLGARVTILDLDGKRLDYLDDIFGPTVTTLISNQENISDSVRNCDLLIGAVLLAGKKAPCLVTRKMVKTMQAGSAIVDVSIDQGGAVETIRATNHDQPFYKEEEVNHYGVTNIPGDVPLTSTEALTNVTLSYARQIAGLGIRKSLASSKPLRLGLNTFSGALSHKGVADAHGLSFDAYTV